MSKRTLRGSSPCALDIVQFAMPIFFCREEDGCVSIDIVRVGSSTGPCSVELSTRDGSAREGVKYVAKTERVEFKRGELVKTVQVALLNDSAFDTTLEFGLSLGAAHGCVLGSSLLRCRVLVEDDDLFPSTRFREAIAEGEEAMCRQVTSLILAYLHLVFLRVPSIWWKSLLTIMIDQLHNVYYLFKVCVRMYLVDCVLTGGATYTSDLLIPGNRNLTAAVLGLGYAAPSFLLMFADRLKEGQLEMGKSIRTHFALNLFRKYMNCSDASKHLVPIQDMVGAIQGDIPTLVDSCYLIAFELAREIGKVFIVGIFLIRNLGIQVLVPLIFLPFVSVSFLRSRQFMHVKLEDEVIVAQADAMGMLVNSVQGFQLIRDYRQRSAISMSYGDNLKRSYLVLTRLSLFKFWNTRFLPALTVTGIGIFLLLGTQLVLLDAISVGAFLASIDMFQELSDRFQTMQNNLDLIIQSGSPLLQITKILNLPTDFEERRANALRRRRQMTERLAVFRASGVPDGYQNAFDAIPIELDSLTVAYVPALCKVRASVPLGRMVYIFGQQGSGKATLLQCIADRKVADQGHAVYPPHNRCLQVSSDHTLLQHLNLYENLTFGCATPEPQRVFDIFSRIGLVANPELLATLQNDIETLLGKRQSSVLHLQPEDTEKQGLLQPSPRPSPRVRRQPEPSSQGQGSVKWQNFLSAMESQKIQLARAFIYNPQILVLHKPVDSADAGDEHDMLLGLIREFVDKRGVCFAADSVETRRPRTCFFSGGDHHARSDKNSSAADIVWKLTATSMSEEKNCDRAPVRQKYDASMRLQSPRILEQTASEMAIWEGGKVRISTWETTRPGVTVRESMCDASPAHRKLKHGAHVRGRQQGDWLALCGEKGFVRTQMTTEEDVERCLVKVTGEHIALELEYEDSGVQCSGAPGPPPAAALDVAAREDFGVQCSEPRRSLPQLDIANSHVLEIESDLRDLGAYGAGRAEAGPPRAAFGQESEGLCFCFNSKKRQPLWVSRMT